MTFPASYNTSSVKNEVVAHRVKKELYEQGIISVKLRLEIGLMCIVSSILCVTYCKNDIAWIFKSLQMRIKNMQDIKIKT